MASLTLKNTALILGSIIGVIAYYFCYRLGGYEGALLGLALCALAAFAVEWKRRGRGYALRFGRRAA